MTAEEYYPIWLEKLKTKCKTEREYISILMRDDTEILYAEAYHKQEVEAISDEDIETHAESVDRLCAHTLGIREGAKWFKNKLLKQ